jgi:RNA polymerase sigma-70 factor (family 1)
MSIAEPVAFDAVFHQLFAPLTRQAARMVDCEHVAEEIVQDVFLTMWNSRASLQVRGDLASYLRRAVRNRAVDYLRRERLHRAWQEAERLSIPLPTLETPGDVYEDTGVDALLDDLFAEMPQRRREVCQLRWRENLRPTEIATRLGIALKTVEAHITLGAKQVRGRLQAA